MIDGEGNLDIERKLLSYWFWATTGKQKTQPLPQQVVPRDDDALVKYFNNVNDFLSNYFIH